MKKLILAAILLCLCVALCACGVKATLVTLSKCVSSVTDDDCAYPNCPNKGADHDNYEIKWGDGKVMYFCEDHHDYAENVVDNTMDYNDVVEDLKTRK